MSIIYQILTCPPPTDEDDEEFECDVCGETFDNSEDTDSIKNIGRCLGCYAEYGDSWPDRV